MTYNEKKSLYESIMKDVAKIVKRQINEDGVVSLNDFRADDALDNLNTEFQYERVSPKDYIIRINLMLDDKTGSMFKRSHGATLMLRLLSIFKLYIKLSELGDEEFEIKLKDLEKDLVKLLEPHIEELFNNMNLMRRKERFLSGDRTDRFQKIF